MVFIKNQQPFFSTLPLKKGIENLEIISCISITTVPHKSSYRLNLKLIVYLKINF